MDKKIFENANTFLIISNNDISKIDFTTLLFNNPFPKPT